MAPSLGCFNNTHLGTSDAVSERRPPHHRNSLNAMLRQSLLWMVLWTILPG
jgi:hypothetical protein